MFSIKSLVNDVWETIHTFSPAERKSRETTKLVFAHLAAADPITWFVICSPYGGDLHTVGKDLPKFEALYNLN